MPTKRKTRKQKERIQYHLETNLLQVQHRWQTKDRQEFAYLEAKYIKKDLLKTFFYSLLMLAILLIAKWRLG